MRIVYTRFHVNQSILRNTTFEKDKKTKRKRTGTGTRTEAAPLRRKDIMQLGTQAPVPQGNYCYAERCHYPDRSRVYRVLWWIRRRCCNGCDDSFKYRKRLKFRCQRACYQVARGLAKLLLLQVAKSLVLLLLACANNHEGLTACSSSLLHAMPKYPVRREILVATFAVLHTVFVKLLRSFTHISSFFLFPISLFARSV